MDGGMNARAFALKPLHVPHLSCPETHAVIVVIRQSPPGGLIWKLCNTCFQFAVVYAAFAQVAQPFAITATIINPKYGGQIRPTLVLALPPAPHCECIDLRAAGGEFRGRLPWISHQANEAQHDSLGDRMSRGPRSWHILSENSAHL